MIKKITNKYQDKRSKSGNFMFNLVAKASMPLIKHRWLYWLLNCTWGILTTLAGCFISLSMLCIGKKPQRWSSAWYFKIGRFWGGMQMGTMFLRDEISCISSNSHEFGHTFQNAILGPFFILLVAIPSAIRYWIRYFKEEKMQSLNAYDSIWFEGSATSIGEYAYSYDIVILTRKTK